MSTDPLGKVGIHSLIEKTVEIEWRSGEPEFLKDAAADRHREGKRFRVFNISDGLVEIQRDTSTGVYGPGPHDRVWVPLSNIAAMRIASGT